MRESSTVHGFVVSATLRIDRIAYFRFQAPALPRRMRSSLPTFLTWVDFSTIVLADWPCPRASAWLIQRQA